MNLYNEDEKKDGAPVIPSGASSFKKSSAFGKPMFSRTAGGIMERLKNLSRKDMAFVGIGLSVLVMAPVAEYMTSKPSTDNLLTPGFGSREGSAATGGVYEPGINALSQGSPDGSGEVITPLSSRDPSSLILGAQPAQAPVAPVSAPPPSSSFRDSMKDAGRNAFSEVAKSAGAPTPIPRMQSALRSFGSFFSGGEGTRTGGTLGGGKILDDAKAASSKAAGRSMVGPVATAGYKGVASNSPHGSSGSAYDKLRAQGDRAASNFSGTSAIGSLDKAAADSVDIGKGTGGLGAGGDSEKTGKPSNSTNKYEHSRSGESLAEMAAKQRMQKALDWEFFKKYEIPKQIINAVVGAVSTSIGKFVGGAIDDVLNPSPAAAKCWVPSVNLVYMPPPAAAGTHDQEADRKNCKNGAVQSPEYYSGAGDKATNAGYTAYCPCGKAASATIDAPKSGADTPASATQTTQSSNAAQAGMDKFDNILSQIITQTGKAADSPKDKAVVVQAAKSVAGGFGEIPGKVDTVLNPLRNSMRSADALRVAYNQKISDYRGSYSVMNGKYEALLKQVETVEAGLTADCSGSKLKMKDLGDGKTAALSKEGCEKVKKDIAAWKEPAQKALSGVNTDLEAHGKALGEFQAQLGIVNKGITQIKTRYDGIFNTYSGISPKPDVATEVAPAIVGLNQMTAQLKESLPDGTAAAAAEKTPVKIAFDLRALNWDETWKTYKLTVNASVAQDEGNKWSQVMNLISAGQPTTADENLVPAQDLVSNFMRSDEISAGIKGKSPDLDDRIKLDLDAIDKDMATLKTNILSSGIDPSYLAAGSDAPATLQKPQGDDKPKPGTGESVATDNRPANVTAGVASSKAVLDRVQGAASALPDTQEDPRYKGYKQAADKAVAAAAVSLGKMQDAQTRLASAPAADRPAIQKEYEAAKTDFDRQTAAANTSISLASGIATNPQLYKPSTPVDQVSPAERKSAASNISVIDACFKYGVGTENGADKCSQARSKRIIAAHTSAKAQFGASLTRTDVENIRTAASSACDEILACRKQKLYEAIGCNKLK